MAGRHCVYLTGLILAALVTLAGCAGATGDGQAPSSLTVTLHAPAEVQAGQTVPLKLTLKNISDRQVSVYIGGRPAEDFVVSNPDGSEAWSFLTGTVVQPILLQITLDPGQESQFDGEWNQVDNFEKPVAAGTYFVRGVLKGETLDGQKFKLETEPRELVVLP